MESKATTAGTSTAAEVEAEFSGPSGHRKWVLAAALLAMFMVAVEATIVATAMPTILAELGGFHLFTWVFVVYLLTQVVTIPIYGKLADMYGRKPVFYFGASLFLLGSMLAGFSGTMEQLIVFRAVQGLGGGAVYPIATTIIGDIYTARERARVQGYISSVWGISSVFGPVLGAFFVQKLHWALVFWVNLPIGVASMLLLALFHHEYIEHRKHSIDYGGALLLVAATTSLMLALIQGHGLSPAALSGLYATAGLCLAAFLAQEWRATEPMMPLGLWRHRVIVTGNLGGLVTNASMIGVASFLPMYVQGVMGHSATVTGLTLTVMSIGWPLASTIGGRLMVRFSYRFVAVMGAAALILGSVVLSLLAPPHGPLWAATGTFLVGVGMGFCTPAFLVSIQSSVAWEQRGVATASNMFMRMTGQALGAAVFGAVINYGLEHIQAGGNAVNLMMKPATRGQLDASELAKLTESLAGALHNVFVIGAALAVITLALSLMVPRGLKP